MEVRRCSLPDPAKKNAMPPDLPQDLRRFILTSVPGVPYLEAMLLLRGEPQRTWTPNEVARRLYLPDSRAAELLTALASASVAAQEAGSYRYAPATKELAAMLDRVAAHYAADLVGVTALIHSRVDKRAQQFAGAFRLTKNS
jgi:hypothetical protein